jgi:hypothetical protein
MRGKRARSAATSLAVMAAFTARSSPCRWRGAGPFH